MRKTKAPRTLRAMTFATLALGALAACAPEPKPAPEPTTPPPLPASTPEQCSIPPDVAAFRTNLLDGINAERAKKKLEPLTVSADLQGIAQKQACDDAVQGIYSHTGLDGSSYKDRLDRIGYPTRHAEENTGMGSPTEGNDTVQTIVGFWMLSVYHRNNMLSPRVNEVGIGRAHGGNGNDFWVVDFGKR